MKKLVALAVLAGIAASASAQSSVTLFGVVDLAARSVKNGDNSVKSLASGGINTSRLGFRGVEDLGGGLLAGFWLESGINADSGTSSDTSTAAAVAKAPTATALGSGATSATTGRFFNRRSTLSLSGGFGEVRLGRDFTPSYTGSADFDTFGDNGVAAYSKFFTTFGSTVDTNTRADNLVSYFLPSGLGGLYGSVAAAAGEGSSGKKYAGGRIGYAAGPLNVSLALGQTTVSQPQTTDDKYKVFDVGASYDLGVVKLNGYYTQNKLASVKVAVYNLGASVPLGLGSVRVGYTKANASGRLGITSIEANDASQWALGYVYNLSKRTALYTTYARVTNKGSASYVVASSPAAVAGAKSTGYEFGVRHSF
jgi:predicted porin